MALKYPRNVVRTFGSILLVQGIVSPLWLSLGLASYVLIPTSLEEVRIPSLIPGGPNTEYVS